LPPAIAPLLDGLLLGLGAAAPIGPVNVEIARRTLRHGRPAGFLLGCGAVTVDVAYALATSLALAPVLRHPRVTTGLSVAAAILLGYLGVACLRSAFRPRPPDANGQPKEGNNHPPLARHYGTGLLLTALNPMTIAFWFVAVPGAAAPSVSAPNGLPLVSAGVFLGAFAWVCFFTTLIGRLHRFGGQRWLAWIDLAGGLTLLTFAGRAIWRLTDSTL
jgi:L-lysine exporter family protein LysE/ArgO